MAGSETDTAPTGALLGSSLELARELLIHGPLSRAELSRRLGLSPASLTRLSRPFLDNGLFVEGLEQGAGVGRPSKPLDVQIDARRFLGIKLTGDEALAVVTDLRANVLADATVPLSGRTLDDVTIAVRAVADELGGDFAGLGVTVGGKVGPDGVVLRAPFLGWRDVPLGAALAASSGLPVIVENDVVALTVAEHWFGLGRGVDDFAVLTIGAGVGYGLVIGDRVIAPPDAGLGLGGHFPLDPSGPLCPDGHRGCSTAMLTVPGVTGQYAAVVGHPVSLPQVLDLSRDGDPAARRVVDSAGRALGTMIAAVANLTMVETVVLAGEGIALFHAGEDAARASLRERRDPEATPVRLLVDDSGFTQWARGAAAAAIQASLARIAL
ncbi:ROK family transcriptional regulator [Microbacteriaceae bacterium VKM Ac-2855]|nr:ROK family transcriptional regulator [Microbacteriaceae bacterium VKM Ac-2855]